MNEIEIEVEEHKQIDTSNFRQRQPVSIIDFASNLDDLANNQSLEENLKNLTSKPNSQENVDYLERTSKNILRSIAYYLNTTNPLNWVFIVFFSIIITLILFIFDSLLKLGLDFRLTICTTGSSFANLIIWVTSSFFFLLIATSVGYFISSDADGSGIPEVKTVISGISIYRYFSVQAFVGKVIGLFAALLGGASIGKVGPFVHISAIVCSRLMKIKIFSKINESTSTKNAMLSAAAAAGITLALGTPIGAVIFSMEVTSSIYLVKNLPTAFACSTICILFSKLLSASTNRNLFVAPEHLNPISDTVIIFDVIFFIILGVICGIIGALLATLVSKLVNIRRKSRLRVLNSRFYYAGITAIIISIITFTVKPLMIFDRYMLSHLFNVNFTKELNELNHPNEGILLLVLFAFKFLITVLTLAMNIPAGIFSPFFLIGAYFGRFYGHFFKTIFTLSEESIYAMVGAACVMSGATHSISSAIIVFELTGQVSYLLPMLLACLIANLTAQAFSISFYDVFLLMKNLPHLPSIKSNQLYGLSIDKIMSKELYPMLINNNLTFINSLEILFRIPRRYSRTIPIPVIDDQGIIKYTIKAKKFIKYMYRIFESYKLNYETEIQTEMNSVIQYILHKLGKKHTSFGQYLKLKIKKIFLTEKEKSMIKIDKSHEEERIRLILMSLKDYSINDNLILSSKIDVAQDQELLSADRSALTIDINFPCLKLQFMFTFLNVSHIFVLDNGSLAGVITKEGFVTKAMLLE